MKLFSLSETLCQVVIPTLIGFLRGFGRNVPGRESLFLKLFDEKMTTHDLAEDALSYRNLVTESMKSVAGVKVPHKKGSTIVDCFEKLSVYVIRKFKIAIRF